METEIEAKFLAVDHESLRQRLKQLGATCEKPMRLMKRYNYDYPDLRLQNEKNGWIRVRDEAGKVTLSYKQLQDRTLHGTKEVSLEVDDFSAAKLFLDSIGLQPTSYQETKRESWKLDDCEIELDHWPWTRPYVEIEAPNEPTLRSVAEKLELPWEAAVHGSVEIVYLAEYDVTEEDVDRIPRITFEDPVPDLLERNKKKDAQ